ncbi:MAG: hypothetical protein D6732_15430 [Methanobacteriota archaeon]|nr:MAG: hypothetical protein D6732_15430 [Euryarchaeota archaeon]
MTQNFDDEIDIDEEVIIDEHEDFPKKKVFRFKKGHGRSEPHVFAFKMGQDCCGGPRGRRHMMRKMMRGFEHGPHQAHHSVFQEVVGDTLKIAALIPGIAKESLKVRAKSDSLILDAKGAEKYKDVLGEREISLKVNLIEKIDPAKVRASYEDGILLLEAPVEGVEEIRIE